LSIGKKGKVEDGLRSIPTSLVSTAEPIRLPPPFTLVRLRERGDAFAHACRIAPESGAGTLVYVGWLDLAEFAVVLEPAGPPGWLATPSWLDPKLGGPRL
jgi:hypothetical protein